MHEASIALAIVDEIGERLSGKPDARVTRVRLAIGVFTGVVPEALSFAWDLAVHGTMADGAVLEIERIPLEIFCRRCGDGCVVEPRFPPLPVCSVCGDPSAEIVRGRELNITSLEVRYADGSARSRTSDSAKKRRARALTA